ncbi:hypothetical protein HNP38_001672 [Chryseobacterium defluvii]|uniref:TonB-like protein n=1 Tax=Chryseobacterium defluvii TaxID=160396 RepID=A0A840KFW8_9FLAO|nr:hypothetical protein [Chryseobacterium defluvii]MBB4806400.1 hypothetical protein [Chryseobacterium defluvii]
MKKIFLLLIAIIFSASGYAQTDKINIKKEINQIYSKYDDSCQVYHDKFLKKYDKRKYRENLNLNEKYNQDFAQFESKRQVFQKTKIENLENLLENVEKETPIIGRKFPISPKDSTVNVQKLQKDPRYKNYDIIKLTKDEEKDMYVDIENIALMRKDFSNFFDTSYFVERDDMLEAKLTFILDTDGSLKKIQAKGNDQEFNLVSILSLYAMKKKYPPAQYKGENVLSRFALPLKMKFE